MKQSKPFSLLLLGSTVVSVALVLLLLLVHYSIQEVGWTTIGIVVLSTWWISFIVFYYFIRNFITVRLKELYRSIRKGKLGQDQMENFSMNEDVISKVELETRKWTDERMREISELRETDEFRREFIGNLAHELKTPVFSIQGYILTLLEGGLEDKNVNRKFLERASKATDRMTAILEDLDQLTKMEVNALELDRTNFDLVELISDIFDDLEMKARKSSISLQFAKEYGAIIVNADKGKIAQVFANLFSNSISYGTEEGTTIVNINRLDDRVNIEVSDDGLGIDEEHLPRLFERFYRVEKSRNRNEGGSGLGLAIVKHIISNHGHTISVESTPGKGSTFTFDLDKAKR